MRRSENRLRAMIDAEPESIQLIQKDGTLLEINTSGLKMMEVESSDVLIGKSVYSLVTPEYQKAYRLMHESVCQGSKETLEFEMIGFKGIKVLKIFTVGKHRKFIEKKHHYCCIKSIPHNKTMHY